MRRMLGRGAAPKPLPQPQPQPTPAPGRMNTWQKRAVRVAGAVVLIAIVLGALFAAMRARTRQAARRARLRARCRSTDPDAVRRTIFVSVVARGRRDVRAAVALIGALFDRARHPARIHVGLCRAAPGDPAAAQRDMPNLGASGMRVGGAAASDHNNSDVGDDDDDDDDEMDIIAAYRAAYPHHDGQFEANVRVHTEEPGAARGAANAMLLVRRHLYRGQRYYATVSVHCRPCYGWDVAALADLDRAVLHRAATATMPAGPTSRKVIITMRPDDEDDQLDDPDEEEDEDDANDANDNNTAYGVTKDARNDGALGANGLLQSAHGPGEANKPATRRGLFMHRLRANGQQRRQARATGGTPKPQRPPTFGVFETWSPRGLPVVRTRAFRHAPVRPFGTPFWHSAFSLCEASPLVGMDPWDPWYEHLTMDGAVDWCTTVRLWTHGWDFYSPTRALVRRTFAQRDFDTAPESPVDVAPTARREREAAYVRAWTLLGMAPPWHARIEPYGLGTARPATEYARLSGIDWLDRRADAHAFVGMWPTRGATPTEPARFDEREVAAKYGSWARFLDETDYRGGAAVQW
ncbi:N-acetyl-glucosamine transferase [Pandoravirus quercus]|uniref:N-acetyl-glucosamine transferase n=2 Tax=Pandoravirus TaxID=2060084 RepID=A0A2U7U8I4_9VIRU|nr:N-acetyl-glucosamine transferase [Pandoravirus quercus]AVK74695.1 N-acetyl-glucosamine transferase [Pandoravirus quercus]QBZ80872.1 N-acetyl-glucosamine transferase domain containing protein [Pandoravirus celtis]